VAKAGKTGERTNLVQHEGFLRHGNFRWAWRAGALCVLAILGYLLVDAEPRPNGGSVFGYIAGTVATLLVLWLTLLGLRKRAITPGNWSLKAWVSAHVYLGLAVMVVTTLHSGFQFGWNIHTLAYGLMVLVVVSGLFGITVYAVLPRYLSRNRGETTQKQMLETLKALDRQINEAAQPLSEAQARVVQMSLDDSRVGGSLWRRLSGGRGGCGNQRALSRLKGLRRQANDVQLQMLDRMEELLLRKAAALSQVRRHLQIRAWLNVWLAFHVPATIALIAAITAHIISVFIYW
jgi:predicted permease